MARCLLCLHDGQGIQLLDLCATYRAYLWQWTLPTPERNRTLRCIQGVQGQLAQAAEQGPPSAMHLSLSVEEKRAIRQLFHDLAHAFVTLVSPAQRMQQLHELTALRLVVEPALRQVQPG